MESPFPSLDAPWCGPTPTNSRTAWSVGPGMHLADGSDAGGRGCRTGYKRSSCNLLSVYSPGFPNLLPAEKVQTTIGLVYDTTRTGQFSSRASKWTDDAEECFTTIAEVGWFPFRDLNILLKSLILGRDIHATPRTRAIAAFPGRVVWYQEPTFPPHATYYMLPTEFPSLTVVSR